MPRDLNHPVWDVYDLLRTARLNVKYYACRVSTLERKNFWIEITLAATASGSAIAGLAFWTTDVGRITWQILITISAILAVAKPLLRYPERIQILAELVADYRIVEHDLKKIEIGIRQERDFTATHRSRFDEVLSRMDDLLRKPGEYNTSSRLRKRCQDEVEREMPSGAFYVPGEEQT